ncbi:MAG: S8 family serine peptidase [Candidatus Bathyarchaeia archaeon]
MIFRFSGRLMLIVVLLPLLFSAMLPTLVVSTKPSRAELLLRFKPGVCRHAGEGLLRSIGACVTDKIPQISVLVISVPEGAAERVKSALMRNLMVDFVEENRLIEPSQTPNDPYYSKQWHLPTIGAPGAWDVSTGSQSIVVAVLDSGVDPSHPDLAGKLLQGWNFYDNNADTSDVYGHGTKVAGTAAAIANNGIGVASVAWNCVILPVRVTDTSGYTSYSLLSKGLTYAADRGAKVAVMSFQIFSGSSLSSAAKYFMDKGGLAVAAAGNTGKYEGYADNPYIVSVSATASGDILASFSSYGPYVDLSAPGVSIYTTVKGGSYGSVSGTSFSAPIVAGVAALIFSANPSLTPADVEQILESTAVDLGDAGYDVYYGWGRVNAYEALKAAAGAAPPPPDTTPPRVEITYPRSGDTVSGAIVVSVSASDDRGVVRVELFKNGVLFAVDSEEPYEFYWDTTAEPDGAYTLVARAYDAAGNVGESNAVSVNVVNFRDVSPPIVSIVKPLDGSTVSRTIDVVASAWDESGVSRVEFYVDGKLAATVSAEPYVYRWNTRSVKDGWHTITAKAYDKYGNAAEATIKVYVSNRK